MSEPIFDLLGKRVWIAGHTGIVGSGVLRRLADEPIGELITATSRQVDHGRQARDRTVRRGGVTGPRDPCRGARGRHPGQPHRPGRVAVRESDDRRERDRGLPTADVEKVVILWSTCIYPRDAPQPMPESTLLTGRLEETNEGYAIAKIAALELGKMYRRQFGMDCIR